ncbi:MAG: preprotein translocase subunit SecE [Clostridia bacterium]|nr:preprotein translocase subunit SecE [Clostridia bacterium]
MAKDEKNKKNKNVKEQKGSFFKESKAELKRVSWPTPKALANDTATVIGIVFVVAIIVIILDFLFLKFNENVILKAEQNIRNKAITTQVVENVETNDSKNQEQENVDENKEKTETTEKTTEDVE